MEDPKPEVKKKSAVKKFFRKLLFYFIAIIVIVIAGFFLICNYNYSEGNRSGVLIRFSNKGVLFKTYEGELNTGGINNISPTAQVNQMWDFSVTKQSVADSLMILGGHKVMLHYCEKVKGMPWQGETNFFVDGIELIKE